MKRLALAVLLLAVVGVAACGDERGPRQRIIDGWIEGLDEPARLGGVPILDHSDGAPVDPHPAVRALVDIGSDAVPDLIAAMGNGSDRARMNAAEALGLIRPSSQEIIQTLLRAAAAGPRGVRATAILALARAGPGNGHVHAFLRGEIASERSDVRTSAIRAAGLLGPHATAFTDQLIAVITTWVSAGASVYPGDGHRNAIEAARALAKIGAAASSAGPALRDAFLASWLYEFGTALGAVRAPESEPTLVAQLTADNQGLRTGALTGLYALGRPIPSALPLVIRLLDDDHPSVSRSAAHLLGGWGPAARDGVPALLKALKHEYAGTRAEAARALGKIGDRATPVLEALRRVRSDRHPVVRDEAEAALSDLAGE